MAADREDKYAVLMVTYKADKTINTVERLTTEEFLAKMNTEGRLTNTAKTDDKYEVYYEFKGGADKGNVSYKVVNTAGNVQKSKNKAKDGDDYCFVVDKNEQITAIYVED